MTNFFLSLSEVQALAKLDPRRGLKLDAEALLEIGKRAGDWLDGFNKPANQTAPTTEPAA